MIKDRGSVRPAKTRTEDQSYGDKEAPVGGHALTGHVIAKLSMPRTVVSQAALHALVIGRQGPIA